MANDTPTPTPAPTTTNPTPPVADQSLALRYSYDQLDAAHKAMADKVAALILAYPDIVKLKDPAAQAAKLKEIQDKQAAAAPAGNSVLSAITPDRNTPIVGGIIGASEDAAAAGKAIGDAKKGFGAAGDMIAAPVTLPFNSVSEYLNQMKVIGNDMTPEKARALGAGYASVLQAKDADRANTSFFGKVFSWDIFTYLGAAFKFGWDKFSHMLGFATTPTKSFNDYVTEGFASADLAAVGPEMAKAKTIGGVDTSEWSQVLTQGGDVQNRAGTDVSVAAPTAENPTPTVTNMDGSPVATDANGNPQVAAPDAGAVASDAWKKTMDVASAQLGDIGGKLKTPAGVVGAVIGGAGAYKFAQGTREQLVKNRVVGKVTTLAEAEVAAMKEVRTAEMALANTKRLHDNNGPLGRAGKAVAGRMGKLKPIPELEANVEAAKAKLAGIDAELEGLGLNLDEVKGVNGNKRVAALASQRIDTMTYAEDGKFADLARSADTPLKKRHVLTTARILGRKVGAPAIEFVTDSLATDVRTMRDIAGAVRDLPQTAPAAGKAIVGGATDIATGTAQNFMRDMRLLTANITTPGAWVPGLGASPEARAMNGLSHRIHTLETEEAGLKARAETLKDVKREKGLSPSQERELRLNQNRTAAIDELLDGRDGKLLRRATTGLRTQLENQLSDYLANKRISPEQAVKDGNLLERWQNIRDGKPVTAKTVAQPEPVTEPVKATVAAEPVAAPKEQVVIRPASETAKPTFRPSLQGGKFASPDAPGHATVRNPMAKTVSEVVAAPKAAPVEVVPVPKTAAANLGADAAVAEEAAAASKIRVPRLGGILAAIPLVVSGGVGGYESGKRKAANGGNAGDIALSAAGGVFYDYNTRAGLASMVGVYDYQDGDILRGLAALPEIAMIPTTRYVDATRRQNAIDGTIAKNRTQFDAVLARTPVTEAVRKGTVKTGDIYLDRLLALKEMQARGVTEVTLEDAPIESVPVIGAIAGFGKMVWNGGKSLLGFKSTPEEDYKGKIHNEGPRVVQNNAKLGGTHTEAGTPLKAAFDMNLAIYLQNGGTMEKLQKAFDGVPKDRPINSRFAGAEGKKNLMADITYWVGPKNAAGVYELLKVGNSYDETVRNLDKNFNGNISADELKALLQPQNGIDAATLQRWFAEGQQARNATKPLNDHFKGAQGNMNAKLDTMYWVGEKNMPKVLAALSKTSIATIDKDGNGNITQAELSAALTKAGVSAADQQKMFAEGKAERESVAKLVGADKVTTVYAATHSAKGSVELDTNHDGIVSKQEAKGALEAAKAKGLTSPELAAALEGVINEARMSVNRGAGTKAQPVKINLGIRAHSVVHGSNITPSSGGSVPQPTRAPAVNA